MRFTQGWALVVVFTAYFGGRYVLRRVIEWNRARHAAEPSPALPLYLWWTVIDLFRHDGDGDVTDDGDGGEGDPDLEFDDRVGFYEDDPDQPNRTHVRWVKKSVVPLPDDEAPTEWRDLDRWVFGALNARDDEGRRRFPYKTIVKDGAAKYRTSASTVERSIRTVRAWAREQGIEL